MEESEMSKFIIDIIIIIKTADREGGGGGDALVALPIEHCKTMIMQHVDDASRYKKLDLNIDIKIHKKFQKSFFTNTINASQNLKISESKMF